MDELNKLFVGNLSYDFDSDGLKEALTEAFAQHGTVKQVEIPMNKITNKIKGIAFVTMSSAEEANAAKEGLDGYELSVDSNDQYPRPMRVDIARPMQPRREGGGSGGYNGNRSGGGRSDYGGGGGGGNRYSSNSRGGGRSDYGGGGDSYSGGSEAEEFTGRRY